MIRLGTTKEPPWLDLLHGVRVQLKPFDPACDIAVQRTVSEALIDGAAPEAAEAAGFLVLAQRRIGAWAGVVDGEGQTAPCDPDTIAEVMVQVPGQLARFRERYLVWAASWSAEGNASATSPNGTSARDPGTAAAA